MGVWRRCTKEKPHGNPVLLPPIHSPAASREPSPPASNALCCSLTGTQSYSLQSTLLQPHGNPVLLRPMHSALASREPSPPASNPLCCSLTGTQSSCVQSTFLF
ncbi:hypothetical protein BgiBS90_008408 [Biomphalaria glabrata]|nr:hypothetical protein BgiBS90_008408 [Biomphalaria glabrata]